MYSKSSTTRKVALVVGANGVIGRNLIEYLKTLSDWEVIGISRRGGESTGRVRYVAVDLLDKVSCIKKLSGLIEVTHILRSLSGPTNLGRACSTKPRDVSEHRGYD